jgi:hypothetical protein
MPLTQPKRDNPLMRPYFRELGLPRKVLVRKHGGSHSQIYMSRDRNAGSDNARKIARGVPNIPGLSDAGAKVEESTCTIAWRITSVACKVRTCKLRDARP